MHLAFRIIDNASAVDDIRIRTVQAKKLLTRALEPVNTELSGRDYLIGNFSAADIMLGHACFMSNRLGCVPEEMSNLKRYVDNISSRPAFDLAINMQ